MAHMSDKLVAGVFKALAHPIRLQIINLLRAGPLCVCEILPNIDSEQSNASQHLAVLRSQGIVESEREGTKVVYRLKSPEVLQVIELAEKMILRQIEETKILLEEKGELKCQRRGIR
ncbi:ArsR/SmtB family transcription factor [Caldicoprobacter guelmensis]|uniref:ArsR/SmtB family transcription factor n=1 Tax=Caldicoprobacter guelmensis TaxID=1170224 RepID=UPI00195850FF|nr:metalloregulator ArsR/SmtB family transcription factor [Caldicoprobacter guelmensis]